MKRFFQCCICLLGTFALLAITTDEVQAQYSVQVLASKDVVTNSVFTNRGLNGVRMERKSNFLKYYYGNFSDAGSAEQALSQALTAGFTNARVVNLVELRASCPPGCLTPVAPPPLPVAAPPPPRVVILPPPPPPPAALPRIENVFFDFDQSFLRQKSQTDLDELAVLMSNYPGYSVELHAHTDSKGRVEYNEALAKRRANSVRNYLINKGVASNRIGEFTYGENNPIAKNKLGSDDAPDGRQLNRRVELRVVSNGQILDVVEDIYVPGHLNK